MARAIKMNSKREHPICKSIPNMKEVMRRQTDNFNKIDYSKRGRAIGKRKIRKKDLVRVESFRDYVKSLDNRTHYGHGDAWYFIAGLMRLYAVSPDITVKHILAIVKDILPETYYAYLDHLGAFDLGPDIPGLDLVINPY